MSVLQDTDCCGLNAFEGFGDYDDSKDVIINMFTEKIYWDSWDRMNRDIREDSIVPFIYFTDVSVNTRKSSGKNLMKYIADNKLGTVVKTRSKKNPNSGNMLTVYVWDTNKKNLLSWLKKNIK